MTPKERISAIRLMEKMEQYPEFSGRLGVEIRFVYSSSDQQDLPMQNQEII